METGRLDQTQLPANVGADCSFTLFFCLLVHYEPNEPPHTQTYKLLIWQVHLVRLLHLHRYNPLWCGVFFLFLRDVNTFAHLNVLSGCCYRYPRRAQWVRGIRQQPGKSEKKKKMRRRSSRWRVRKKREWTTIIQLVVILSKERMWKRWKERKMTGEEQENELATCHQSLVVSYTHALTHPLIPSISQPNEPSVSQWLLYTTNTITQPL